jgi:hypothetical protein
VKPFTTPQKSTGNWPLLLSLLLLPLLLLLLASLAPHMCEVTPLFTG